jgi:hypothetical protein
LRPVANIHSCSLLKYSMDSDYHMFSRHEFDLLVRKLSAS